VINVQSVAQPVSELVQLQSAAVSSEPEPASSINLPPQPMSSVVSSASVPAEQAQALPVTAEAAPAAASETTQVVSSLPSQLRSSKRSTHRAAKSSHKSGSVSDGLLFVLMCWFGQLLADISLCIRPRDPALLYLVGSACLIDFLYV